MKRKVALFAFFTAVVLLTAMPAFAQGPEEGRWSSTWGLAVGMGIAAAGCGLAQSNTLKGAFDGVSRNPGAADTIRIFVFLGLALIEFLALLTFLVCYLVLGAMTAP